MENVWFEVCGWFEEERIESSDLSMREIALLPETQRWIADQISTLSEQISATRNEALRASLHVRIASFLQLLSTSSHEFKSNKEWTEGQSREPKQDHEHHLLNLRLAAQQLEHAIQLLQNNRGPLLRRYIWELRRIQKWEKAASAILKQPLKGTGLLKCPPVPFNVPVLAGNCLSVEDFITKYEQTSSPLVLTGLVGEILTELGKAKVIREQNRLSIQDVRNAVGHKVVNLKRRQKGSANWGEFEGGTCMSICEFIDTHFDLFSVGKKRKRWLFLRICWSP